jgi:hypothetical protein
MLTMIVFSWVTSSEVYGCGGAATAADDDDDDDDIMLTIILFSGDYTV